MSAQPGSPQVGFDPSVFGPFGSAVQALSDISRQDLAAAAANGLRPEAMMEQATAATKSVARVQLELARLAVRRMQSYMQVPTQLASCRTPRDLADVQMSFWHAAMEQYLGSSHRLMEAWTGAVPAMCALGGADRRSAGEREHDYITFGTTDAKGLDQSAAASTGTRRVA